MTKPQSLAFSVVIPVHNQAPRLQLTLAALEQQDELTPREYEVIVVDDASQDRLGDVVENAQRHAPYSLRLISTSSGGCRGLPRNLGAAHACGVFILFLDADACPSRRLLVQHLRAQMAERHRVALGECRVIAKTEWLLDPITGQRWANAPTSLGTPFRISPAELREKGDAVLAPESEPGIYPELARWQVQVQQAMLAGSALGWVGAIPHNLSMPRDFFSRMRGFDVTLRHLEGWDFGLRARRYGGSFGWAAGARTFHLYHRREMGSQVENILASQHELLDRYPDQGIEAVSLWTASLSREPYVPPELGLASWRVLERSVADPSRRARLTSIYARHLKTRRPWSPMDCVVNALNSPFTLCIHRGLDRLTC